jgi:Uma2 family endonuclease
MLHALSFLTPEDYLARESLTPVRYEYVNGEVYALSGTTLRHGTLVTNLVAHTFAAAGRRPPCRVFSQCVKVHIPARNSYYYPDVVATCEPCALEQYIIREPCFIVEVLSPTTANIDRREKRNAYMTLDSLGEYVLLDQDRMRADVYRRKGDCWNLAVLDEPSQVVEISCLECALTLEQLYAGINLPLRVSEAMEEEEDWLTA